MGLLDILGAIFNSVANDTVRQRDDFARKFEREHPNMDKATREKFDAFQKKTDKFSDWSGVSRRTYSGTSSNSNHISNIIGDKTITQWDSQWKCIGPLETADLSLYNHCVGLYRHTINGKTMYVGRAIELHNGGFRKRLSDYRRESNSARTHTSGQKIHEHLSEIVTYILVVGDTEEAIAITRKLEGEFVRKYNPEWNKQINI